ncbi:Abhydrolase family protein [Anatilimnocola aggregata]|uniref:Abhydrolase family protein n=1 Tax=Anatilimnocola aggregata TaxID=2528021 RepID=A0A517YEG6_9BACT|nr:alpha/beta hydrolase family protein [Anatilimnocola aggregata]QDU28623.1 Abhydrolase family protein [Anatilimnocola aggregata]
MQPSPRREFLKAIGTGSLALTGGMSAIGNAGPFVAAQKVAAAEMPADLPVEQAPANADLGSLYPVVRGLAEKVPYPYSFLSGRFASLAEQQAAGREKVLEAFGYRPAAVAPNAEVVSRQEFPEFTREKILFSTSPQFRVPAYVHIPRGLKERGPAIVDLHSHGGMFLFGKEKVIDFGTNHLTMKTYHERNYGGRPTTTELVKRGYVVITIDAFMFGERRARFAEDQELGSNRGDYSPATVDLLNRKCRSKESTLAKSLIYAGICWPGIITWDDMRTVDYLVTRPEVDPARIGCLGVSLGGWRTIFLAGLDERIAAACVVGFMSTVQPMIERHINTHSFAHFVPGLHQYLDLPDVVALRAPRPLLVQQCRQDGLFPVQGMEDSVTKIAAIYERAGAKEKFAGQFYDVPHQFNVAMQDDAFSWLDRQLKPT